MPEELYAHVVLEGVEIGPGDTVLVHEAPTRIAYGERIAIDRRATVVKAGWFKRLWARLSEPFWLIIHD
jgi:hypothetical protein